MNMVEGGHSVESVDTLRRPVHTVMRDRSMRVIMPSTTSGFANIIHTIKLLDNFLSLSTTRRVFDAILDPDVNAIVKNSPKKIKQQKVDQNDSQDQQPHQHPEILNHADAINGIRHIQGGRYEVFVKARVKSTCVFDWICQQIWTMHYEQLPPAPAGNTNEFASYESSDHIKQAIMQYAIHQAERDDRITVNTTNKSAPSYDNFSLIVSYDPVEAQPRHIDLLYPNFQFGLIVTDHSPGTSVYVTPHSIRTVTDVKNHVWKDMSSTMFNAMKQHAIVTSLLSQFGDVLCPSMELVQYWKHGNDRKEENNDMVEGTSEPPPNTTHGECTTSNEVFFPTGTLLSLPGSEIHAGPASSKYRTVLFFSACPDMTNTIPYHPDTQYFSPLLCCDFVCLLWNNLSIDDRIYILNRLIDCINDTKCQHLDRHIGDAKMIHFLRTVTGREETMESPRSHVIKYGRYSNIQDYIRYFASQRKAIDSEKNGVDIVGAIPEYCESLQLTSTATENPATAMNVISSPDLVVEFEGEYFPAHVFEHQPPVSVTVTPVSIDHDDAIGTRAERRNVSKVTLFYPLDQSWEGTFVPYTLEWKQEGNVRPITNAANSDIEYSDGRILFDGTNGILRDSDGYVIPCYPKCLTSVSSQVNDTIVKKPKKRKRRKSIIPLSVRPRQQKPIQTFDETSTTISSELTVSSPKSEPISRKSPDDVEMINSPGTIHKRPSISEGGVMCDILQYIRG